MYNRINKIPLAGDFLCGVVVLQSSDIVLGDEYDAVFLQYLCGSAVVCHTEYNVCVALVNGEEFYMLIPEGYVSQNIITYITCDGYSGNVYKNGAVHNFDSTDVGKYVKMRYSYYERTNPDRVIREFEVVV